MASIGFEHLKVYQLSEQLADDIWKIVQDWELTPKRTVGWQIIRSSDAVGANIAEGSGRGSFLDNKRFVRMARGSLYETRHWLRRAYARGLLTSEQIEQLKNTIDNLGPMLNGYLKSIGNLRTKD